MDTYTQLCRERGKEKCNSCKLDCVVSLPSHIPMDTNCNILQQLRDELIFLFVQRDSTLIEISWILRRVLDEFYMPGRSVSQEGIYSHTNSCAISFRWQSRNPIQIWMIVIIWAFSVFNIWTNFWDAVDPKAFMKRIILARFYLSLPGKMIRWGIAVEKLN